MKNYEHLYYEQVRLIKQLLDQIKTVKQTKEDAASKAKREAELKLMKNLEHQEYLDYKVQRLEAENSSLKKELSGLSAQVEGSLRNN